MSSSKGSILLTGPNGGIGIGFIVNFLKSPYALTHSAIYAVRDPAKATALKRTLETAPKEHKYLILAVDLTSQTSIRSFATDVNSRISSGFLAPITALMLNAGVQDISREYYTDDGFERTFFVNYLANFLLTLLLLGSMDKECGRIIYTGSTAADTSWKINDGYYSKEEQKDAITKCSVDMMAKGQEKFPDGNVEKTGQRRYALSKILLEVWMYELQRRLDADPSLKNISVLGHDPGWIGSTDIVRNGSTSLQFIFSTLRIIAKFTWLFSSNPMIRTAELNGRFLLTLCFDKEKFGEYPKAKYVDGGVLYKTVPEAENEKLQGELWEKSLEFVGLKGEETVLKEWK
ncbi:hypothetical protein VTL71DRAFT_9757 [Oculimacula yallundae]|uniref:3beta-hydroxysteroid 3-dehydrogenase n=1 Tax=Oculimacula yallundae TaxID=86028 RepID=A0ABR4BSL5_9HELO